MLPKECCHFISSISSYTVFILVLFKHAVCCGKNMPFANQGTSADTPSWIEKNLPWNRVLVSISTTNNSVATRIGIESSFTTSYALYQYDVKIWLLVGFQNLIWDYFLFIEDISYLDNFPRHLKEKDIRINLGIGEL